LSSGTPSEIVQRLLDPAASAEQYLALFDDCFPEVRGASIATPEHYFWKYGAAGKDAPAFESGAFEGERMVGYYAALPFHYRMSGQRMTGGLVCDVMTHSEMRGRGMFTAQGRFATAAMGKAGIAFSTGFPIRPEVIPGHLKVGWSIAFELPVFVRLLRPRQVLESRKAGWLSPLVLPVTAVYQAACRLTRPGNQAARVERLTIDELLSRPQFAEFHERWIAQYTNCLERSDPFLRWRLAAPKSSYRVLALYAGEKLQGVAFLRDTMLSHFRMTAIVDLMLTPEAAPFGGALHDAMADVVRESSTAGLVIMCAIPDAARLSLYRYGFWKTPIVFKLILKWLRDDPVPPHFLSAQHWHLTWLDTDNL
jgi:hypothetical protein